MKLRICEYKCAIQKLWWDVLGLSETKVIGEALINRKNETVITYYGGSTNRYPSNEFYINNRIWHNLTVNISKKVSGRIGALENQN